MPELLTNLGAALLLSQEELSRLIRSAPHRYKTYQIPKRKPGQFRTIAQPAREVKALQYWVMKHVLNQFSIHPAATGYRSGLNIADNARRHANSRFLLKLDFENFFPSIKSTDFRLYIERHAPQFTRGEVEALSQILFWNPRHTNDMCLSIGAPSSPLMSNILLRDFDDRVASFCSELEVSYTRYADDLSFSANVSEKLRQVEEMVKRVSEGLESPKLTLNRDKTVRASKKRSRRVTGLVLTNDARVSLGRDHKRRIRASVHHFLTGRLTRDQCTELRGMLAYVKSVEPGLLSRLRKRYGADVIRKILTVN
jgi:retron-type reverse transcriptase